VTLESDRGKLESTRLELESLSLMYQMQYLDLRIGYSILHMDRNIRYNFIFDAVLQFELVLMIYRRSTGSKYNYCLKFDHKDNLIKTKIYELLRHEGNYWSRRSKAKVSNIK